MKANVFMFAAVLCAATVVHSSGAEAEERETFGKWRLGVGAAFNGGVRANVRSRGLPEPHMYMVPIGSTKEDAIRRALAHVYDGGGLIRPDSSNLAPNPDDWYDTENWTLPRSSYRGNGKFLLDNAYEEVLGSAFDATARDSSDSEMQFGISVEVARELWLHDEADEHRWGVDFAAAFSYFFRRDVYSSCGTVRRTDMVRDGVVRTEVNDPAATYDYDPDNLPEMLGDLNYQRTGTIHPALGWDTIGESVPLDNRPSHPVTTSYGYTANGDYQELEMLFMLRPWYEITDWWRVFAQAGVGVSWGRFDCTFRGAGVSADEDFSQWDVYGVAGLGTAFRYGHWDIGIDFLGRFLRDDLDVDGRYVSGSIDRADWGFRVLLGYSF